MANEISALTEICDSQVNFTRVSISSFLNSNPWFCGKIYLLCVPGTATSSQSIESIRRIYEKIEVITTDLDPTFESSLNLKKTRLSDQDLLSLAYLEVFKLPLKKFIYFSNKSLFLKSIDQILIADRLVSDGTFQLFYYGYWEEIRSFSLNALFYNDFKSLSKNFISIKAIESIFNKCMQSLDPIKSDLTTGFSSKYRNSELSKLTFFVRHASCIFYDSFDQRAVFYSKINSNWLAAHKKISEKLNSPRSFVQEGISQIPIKEIREIQYKVAVLIHCYYYDIMPEIKKYVNNLKIPHDIFINVPISVKDEAKINWIKELFPEAIINFSENRGRDIGGFVSLWSQYRADSYTSALLLHTKKSPHIKSGAAWRQNLLNSILSNPQIANSNASQIYPESSIGIIGSKQHRNFSIGHNSSHLLKLNQMFGIPKNLTKIDYVSGTMMFISPQILDLLCSKITQADFKDGTGLNLSHHMDGQLEHAVERFLATLCKKLGKTIKYI